MLRLRSTRPHCFGAGPRAGGDAPVATGVQSASPTRSPRRRGCSGHAGIAQQSGAPVPAQAGMLRSRSHRGSQGRAGPRAGGDAPSAFSNQLKGNYRSPRRRGCSEPRPVRAAQAHPVPAQAGMLRGNVRRGRHVGTGPRAGGDAPTLHEPEHRLDVRFPRRRECSGGGPHRDRRQAPVPAQGGCSGACTGHCSALLPVPAQAGMLRPSTPAMARRCPGLRAGGDAPTQLGGVQSGAERSPRRLGCSGQVVVA